jgi:hypothetical protein
VGTLLPWPEHHREENRVREFITAVEASEEETEGWTEFKVDGTDCKAMRPSPAQVAYLTASMHKRAPIQQQVAGAINFCMAIMDEETASYLSERLLDNGDKFGLAQVQDIIEGLIEDWAGRPTEPSSDSVPTEPSTGSTSTGNGQTSTSSGSVSIAG